MGCSSEGLLPVVVGHILKSPAALVSEPPKKVLKAAAAARPAFRLQPDPSESEGSSNGDIGGNGAGATDDEQVGSQGSGAARSSDQSPKRSPRLIVQAAHQLHVTRVRDCCLFALTEKSIMQDWLVKLCITPAGELISKEEQAILFGPKGVIHK